MMVVNQMGRETLLADGSKRLHQFNKLGRLPWLPSLKSNAPQYGMMVKAGGTLTWHSLPWYQHLPSLRVTRNAWSLRDHLRPNRKAYLPPLHQNKRYHWFQSTDMTFKYYSANTENLTQIFSEKISII